MKHPERVEDYLEHIAEAIRRAIRYAGPIDDHLALARNEQAQDAILRNIVVIGEAAKQIQKIDPTFVAQNPGVPWKEIRGMRNALVHDYFDVDWQRVLGTVKSDLPALQEKIEQVLADARKSLK